MHTKIRLTLRQGNLDCREYTLQRRGQYVIGRAHDCDIRLVGEGVSRHHCVLAFDPPRLRIRDLGSRNGTFLNNDLIGQRGRPAPLAADQLDDFEDHEVSDRDELRVGGLTFRVEVLDASQVHEPLPIW